jgi:hypothetical protein
MQYFMTHTNYPKLNANLNISGGSKMKSEKEFNAQLLCAIDDALRQIFTEAGMKIIYNYLDKQCSLKREDVPEKLDAFVQGLENFFTSGAVVVELVILKNLCLSLGFKVKQIQHKQDFVECIEKLKSHFCIRKK